MTRDHLRWLTVDLVFVSSFAVAGRLSHHEPVTLGTWWLTAWPFLVGLLCGWLAVVSLGWPAGGLRAGVTEVGIIVAVAMTLRVLTGAGTAAAFVLVSVATLGLLLVGSRLGTILVRGRGQLTGRS